MTRYMNHREAAKYLGIDERKLYKLVAKEYIPYGKRGKSLIYDRVRLDDWVDICHEKHGVTLQEAVGRYIKKGNLL